MRKLRSIIGILLIIISIAGLFFWEWKGRETILLEEVLVAKEEIKRGTIVDSSMFIPKGVPKDNMLEEALIPGDMTLVKGKVTSQLIAKNAQILVKYFKDNDFSLDQDESIFVIDSSWVAMRSSALRRGDLVDIYGSNGSGILGTFRIAYVKDASEREVRNAVEETEGGAASDILNRTDSTSVIDHIEIISTFRAYENLVNVVNGITPAALIIVQRGDQIAS